VTLRRRFNGAKSYTEAWDSERDGRRALNESGSQSESAGGSHSSENAGMSSEKYVRIILAESLRILEEGSSAPGKPGAKVRPKGVADAHTVEIP
jgi:hypothetical protein